MKAINHSDAASPTGTHPGAKQKTEMVFVYPQFNDVIKGYVEAFTFSLSTAYIRAYLAGKGLHTEQYLQNRPGTVRQCAREIIAMGADIIGFSCVDSTLYYSILVADAVKEIKPDAVIIFGGASHTLSDKFIMENHPSVDICCRGEGEETCFELIVKLRDKQDLDDISGITFRRDNQLVRTPPRPLREEGEKNCGLDFLPSPYLSGMIDFEKLQDNDLFQYSLLTARGCPHQCTYCTNTAMGHFKVRYHSVERVISEIKEMSKRVTPGQNIVIYDDAFTIHVKRAKAICRRIIEENLAHIGYECMTRIDKFDEELLQLLHQAGFKVVIFGLESSNPSILNTIKKARSQPAVNGDYRPEQRFLDTMKQNIAKVKAIGMGTGVSFILGLPGETKKEARETLDFVQSLNVDYCIHNFLDISRGTEIFETCGNYGIGMRPSPFILPPITEFAYDVFELTPLDISVNINLLETWNTEGVEMLLEMFGAWKTDITGGKTDGLHVFIETLPADENRLFQWLADIVPFNGIVFIVEDNWEKYSFENRLFSFAKSKMPLNVYRRMKKLAPSEPGKNTRGAVSYGLKFFHRIRIPYAQCTDGGEPEMSFHIMPVSEPDELKTDPAGGLKLKTIDTKKDFRTLVDLVEGKNEIRLTRDQFDTYNYTVLNRCRWSNQTCDACAFHKLIIGEDDSLFTCYRSRPIGKVGDSFEALKANVDAIAQETRRRRGCADCPVKDNCAQCLFLPDYLDDADYCTIMKENREITFKMDIPSVVLQLKAQLGEQLENTEEIRISWPAPTVMDTILQEQNFQPVFGVEINGMSLLFNAGKRIFSSLSGTMSQIWKRLISGESDREILCRQLADERNISLKAITNSFNMLVGKIREISQ